MNSRTSKLLMALNLLVVVALIAAVVQVYGAQTGTPDVTVDALATDASEQYEEDAELETDDVDLEGDSFTLESKFYAGTDFKIRSGGDTISYDGQGCVSAVSGGQLRIEVQLPDDATVTNLTMYADDTDGASSMSMNAWYIDYSSYGSSGSSLNSWYSASTGSADDSGNQTVAASDPTTDGDEVIDTVNRAYEVIVSGTDSNESLCGIRILWTPESTTELTFHEVEPCAVFDTREGRGGREAPLAGLETVAFDMIMSDYSGQGGVASSCGVPSPNGGLFGNGEGTVAVMLNLVALNPQDSGNLKAWDPDTTEPDGGILVYTAGENGNVVLPMAVEHATFNPIGSSEDGGDINVKNNGGDPVDVRGVVVGYFTKPLINQE